MPIHPDSTATPIAVPGMPPWFLNRRQRLPWRQLSVPAFAVCLVGSLLLLRSHFALVWTIGDSMQPTIRNGSLLLVQKDAYHRAAPRRGDVVVARYDGELITKRVVGLPGETVEVRQGALFVNGTRRAEAHGTLPGVLTIQAGTLHTDRYALLGDNRDLSAPAAVYAVVGRNQLLGRVLATLPLWGSRGDADSD